MVSEGQAEKRTYSLVGSDYKLFEEVGQGVTATVYRAHCLPFNETVAIKSLDLEKCNSNLVTFSDLFFLVFWVESDFYRSKPLDSSVKLGSGRRPSSTFESDKSYLEGITDPSNEYGPHGVRGLAVMRKIQ